MTQSFLIWGCALSIGSAALCLSCGADGGALSESHRPEPTGSHGVTQAGAADIGAFRTLLEAGEVPPLSTLDQVGFFAEHALDQPPADCGETLCAHPSLAVAPRFEGGNWTMALVTLNTPVDPASREREPLHLVMALEESAYTEDLRAAAIGGMHTIAGSLGSEDRLSVVVYGSGASAIAIGANPTSDPLTGAAFGSANAGESPVDLFAGLSEAQALATSLEDFIGDAHVLLLTSGHAETGITERARLVESATGPVVSGVGLSVVGFGDDIRYQTVQALGGIGAGSYAVASDAGDLSDALETFAATDFIPLARDVELQVTAAEGYRVGRTHGARLASGTSDSARFHLPAVYLGARTGSDDVDSGRRGGGGGFFVQLDADGQGAALGDQPAFSAFLGYTDAFTGDRVESTIVVENPLPPGQNPDENWPIFTDVDRGKAFMMLNMYLALSTTVRLYEEGDCAGARGVVEMMQLPIELWQERYDDPDIAADAALLGALDENIESRCSATAPAPPADFEGGCFGL